MASISTHITLLRALGAEKPGDAWPEFVQRYGGLIRGVALRRGLSPTEADDILQDVLLALTDSMKRFEYDPARGSFRGYLKTITLRAVYARFRQKRPVSTQTVVEEPGGDLAAEMDAIWEDEWRQHHLRRAMDRIPSEFSEPDVAAFRAYAIEQRPVDEVAAALGRSVDQIYQAKSRVLRRVRELVAEQIEEEG